MWYRTEQKDGVTRYRCMVFSNLPDDTVLGPLMRRCPWAAVTDSVDMLPGVLEGIVDSLPPEAGGKLDRIDLVGHAGSAALQLGDGSGNPNDVSEHFIHMNADALATVSTAVRQHLRPGGEIRLLGCQTATTPARGSVSIDNDGAGLCGTLARHSGHIVQGSCRDIVTGDFDADGFVDKEQMLVAFNPLALGASDPLGGPAPPVEAAETSTPLVRSVPIAATAACGGRKGFSVEDGVVLLPPETPLGPPDSRWPWSRTQQELVAALDALTVPTLLAFLQAPLARRDPALGLRRRVRRIVGLNGKPLGEIALIGNGELLHMADGQEAWSVAGSALLETLRAQSAAPDGTLV